jgi:3-oxoacyl-[acyl-carrier-protein] synthase II
MSRRIAVTGMAWLTSLGDDLEQVWQSLLDGRSGLRKIPFAGRLRNDLAAPITNGGCPPAEHLVKMASQTIRRALLSSGHEADDPDVQLVLGTSLGAFLEDEKSRRSLSGWAHAVARELGIARPPVVLSTACSAGADAVMVGAELIRAGIAKSVVCGGADVFTESKRLAHSALGTMSPTTLRAFDVRHDGTLLGEGAAFMVLEPARAGQEVLAIFRGAGSANDATGMTVADMTGLSARYAMERSLVDAGLPASAIGVISAHGSGTPMSDTTEGKAFEGMFSGSTQPIVFATKGNFGHTLGATGAIEAIALLLALRSGIVPPIPGLEQPLPGFPLQLSATAPISCPARVGLSLTLGFGGFDTSLVFEVPS